MDWDDLKFALAVARHGSLTAASRALGTTQPTVSRRLDAFERCIGGRLFERTKDGLVPTPLGADLLAPLARMEDEALAIERRIAAQDGGLQGPITVTSLDWLGDYVIAPLLTRFAVQHTQVKVELRNDARMFNLSRREADVAFRFSDFEQEDLVARTLAHASYALYASADYLAARGLPDFGTACSGHAVLILHESAPGVVYRDWLFELLPEVHVALRSNGLQSHLGAVEQGVAMAVLPRFVGDARPDLQRLATPLPDPVQPIRLGVHADMRDSPRIRALIEFAAAELESLAERLRPA